MITPDADPLEGILERGNRARLAAADWVARKTGGRLGEQTVTATLAVAAIALVVLALGAVFSLLAALYRLGVDAGTAGWQATVSGAERVTDLPAVGLAVTSIERFFATHAAGVADPTVLAAAWGIAGAALALLGMLVRARGAQITWPVYGAATTAAAWLGATEQHAPAAAGVIVLAWCLASVLVWRRPLTTPSTAPVVHVHTPGGTDRGEAR